LKPSVDVGQPCVRRVALRVVAAVSLMAGAVIVLSPAGSAASSAYAVTELQFGPGVADIGGGVAADPATDTVYAATGDSGVAVINGASGTVAAQIKVPLAAVAVAVDQASDSVFAIAPGPQAAAYVINGATDAVTATISLPSGLETFAAAANPVTHMVYVTDYAHGTVVVIDGSTDTVAATIPLADPVIAPDPFPWGLAVDTATNTVYVADERDDQVAVIDGATNTVTGRIALPAGSDPTGVAVNRAAGLVYTADAGTGAISVIDTATGSVSTLASGMSDPEGLAPDSGSGTLYASGPGPADRAGATYVIDTASGAITARIPRGGASIAVPASGSAFVGQNGGRLSQYLTVIKRGTVSTMSPVIVGADSFNFIVGRAGQHQLRASATPAATFSATGLPDWLALSPSGLLSGTPPASTVGTTYFIPVTAANGVAPPFTWTITVTVDQGPAITSADQATFQVGVPGSFAATATGFPAPTFSESGTLPAGVTFSAGGPGTDGVLSGTPAAGTAGSYPIHIKATNRIGTATQAFTLIVNEPPSTGRSALKKVDLAGK
jgi:large repetitive protein